MKLAVDCEVVFKNSGKTPAKNISFASICEANFHSFTEAGIRKEFNLNEETEEPMQRGFTSPPNGSFVKKRMFIIDIDTDSLIGLGSEQYISPGIAVMARYTDETDIIRETIQAFSILENRNGKGLWFNVAVSLTVDYMGGTHEIEISPIGISTMT